MYTKAELKQQLQNAGLTGKETVVDAYCGIGTIGIVAAAAAKEVIGVELHIRTDTPPQSRTDRELW